MKNELTKLVEETFGKIPLPMSIRVRESEEVHGDPKDSYFIQVSIGSKEFKPDCSFFDMWYNRGENRFEHGYLKLKEHLQGQGYGRELAEAREELARKLGCRRIRINLNNNQSFWEYMGFKSNGQYWEKEL